MNLETSPRDAIAFAGHRLIHRGQLRDVVHKAKLLVDSSPDESILVFDEGTSHPIEINFRGSTEEVLARLNFKSGSSEEKRSPGRPKLGVVAREVTLLPRHWDWLNDQPGGASVAIRKLVEAAVRSHAPADRIREARESLYRFMTAMAGDLAGYEEALRAIYSGDEPRFRKETRKWPKAIREHTQHLAGAAFDAGPSGPLN